MAKLLVEQWIHFKEGEEHASPQNDAAGLSMQEFIDRRNDLLQEIHEFNDPDFAQPGLLPVNARLRGDPKDVEDQWEELCRKPMTGMKEEQWSEAYSTIRQVFTGPYIGVDNTRFRLERFRRATWRDSSRDRDSSLKTGAQLLHLLEVPSI